MRLWQRLRARLGFALEFLSIESAGGLIMIATAALALVLANSALAEAYHSLIHTPIVAGISLKLFTNDVLMTAFFFTVGMELKHEMNEGALVTARQRILPLMAALGGVVAPALLYLAITHAAPEYRTGWAIPTATDIAFAICVLRLIGNKIPPTAIVFLLALAIYDDLAAILIIALFYSSHLALLPLAIAGGIIAGMLALRRWQTGQIWTYLLLGALLWWALHAAGIHPTLAGMVTGLLIPLRNRMGAPVLATLLHRTHPYVAFGVLPLFAFCSAGVALQLSALDSTLPMAIALALFFGKPVGIFGATWLCVRFGLATLPTGTSWPIIYGLSVIAGIGFTMSLFIGNLAFPAAMQDAITIGVLAGSLLSACWGAIVCCQLIGRTP